MKGRGTGKEKGITVYCAEFKPTVTVPAAEQWLLGWYQIGDSLVTDT